MGTVNIKIANEKSIVELFEGLADGVNKSATWQKFWRLNVKPFIKAAQNKAPISKIGDHKYEFTGGV